MLCHLFHLPGFYSSMGLKSPTCSIIGSFSGVVKRPATSRSERLLARDFLGHELLGKLFLLVGHIRLSWEVVFQLFCNIFPGI